MFTVSQAMQSRSRHLRPQLQRGQWRSLEGVWEFAFDPTGRHEHPGSVSFDMSINVPFPPESPASGIGDPGYHRVLWYRRIVELSPDECARALLLHFGAVDFHAKVWVNQRLVVEHRGGHTPFSADISNARGSVDRLEIIVRAEDDPHDLAKPRGKQDWQLNPHQIWYPRTSGIWQPVWLEPVPHVHIERIRWTPYLDSWEIGFDLGLSRIAEPNSSIRLVMHREGVVLVDDRYSISGQDLVRRIALADPGIEDYRNQLLWRPGNPALLEAEIELWQDGKCVDAVWSYTALRSVGVQGNRFMLNGRPYYLRMVLDQGYWSETHLAAPDGDALRRDVELAIAHGFNGVRKHQKLEDPRWFFWCDVLGILAWSEMPSPYRFSAAAVERTVSEWMEGVRRDLSHPCIVTWVPLNESWGVPDLPSNPAHRDHVRALFHLTKTLDPTRPVVGNDGWEHVATDIVTVHDYASNPKTLLERYGTPESAAAVLQRQQPGGRALMLPGFSLEDRPLVLSEFGGIAIGGRGWGYSQRPLDELLTAYSRLLEAVHSCQALAGFCYTQLFDTFQEQNGLVTADRVPKLDPAAVAAATRGRRRAEAMDVDPEPMVPTYEAGPDEGV